MHYPSLAYRAVILTAGLLCATGVHAADGQLEINQACAVNTGCFPGDAPGFPVTITQPGSYRLTGNLDLSAVDPGLSGIQASAPAVTVDLSGFHIAGATTCSGSGASISCSPSGTGSGVHFTNDATASVVQNGIVRNMTNSGVFCLATGARVQNITATHNANDGIFAQQGTLVVNSVAIENGGDGINVTSGSIVDGVTSIGNGQNGIRAEGFSGGSVVTRTVAQKNGASGFMLFGLAKFGKNNLSIGNKDADKCGGGICTDRTRLYLTKAQHQGDTVLSACAIGFRVASQTELLDIGHYAYDTILGKTTRHSGGGPPSGTPVFGTTVTAGWVLSGSDRELGDCAGWTTSNFEIGGSIIWFPTSIGDDPDVLSQMPRRADVVCSSNLPVWCISTP